jgi:hypothetical protein
VDLQSAFRTLYVLILAALFVTLPGIAFCLAREKIVQIEITQKVY